LISFVQARIGDASGAAWIDVPANNAAFPDLASPAAVTATPNLQNNLGGWLATFLPPNPRTTTLQVTIGPNFNRNATKAPLKLFVCDHGQRRVCRAQTIAIGAAVAPPARGALFQV
jgi:hypothetical protein